jgi:hypothetical protein
MRQLLSRQWPHILGLLSVPRRGGEFGIFDFPVLKFCPYHVSDGLTRTQFRRQANAADNKAATVAVDSLLNYEAVKVCAHLNVCGETWTDGAYSQRILTTSNTRFSSMTHIYAHTKRRLSKLPPHSLFSTSARMSYIHQLSPGLCSLLLRESLTVS